LSRQQHENTKTVRIPETTKKTAAVGSFIEPVPGAYSRALSVGLHIHRWVVLRVFVDRLRSFVFSCPGRAYC